ADGVGVDAATFGDRIRRVLRIEIALDDALEHRHRLATIRQGELADDSGLDAGGVGAGESTALRAATLTPTLSRQRERELTIAPSMPLLLAGDVGAKLRVRVVTVAGLLVPAQ